MKFEHASHLSYDKSHNWCMIYRTKNWIMYGTLKRNLWIKVTLCILPCLTRSLLETDCTSCRRADNRINFVTTLYNTHSRTGFPVETSSNCQTIIHLRVHKQKNWKNTGTARLSWRKWVAMTVSYGWP